MKVLQVVADGSPGGGTTNVLALTEDLIANGVDVSFCSQQSSYAINQATQLGASVIDNLDFWNGRLDRAVVSKLASAVDDVNPDIIHVHGGRAGFAWVRSNHRQRLKRTMYTVRGYHFRRKILPLRILAKQVERKISHSVFQTVHVCEDNQQMALSLGLIPSLSASQVIRNGIRVQDIPIPRKPGDLKNVAVLGRLTYPKNPDLVLNIAKKLRDEGFVFHVIGGGDLQRQVQQRVENEAIANVVLYGEKPRDEAVQLMSVAGTYLMPSRWEGLPIAPVEAMAMGLAVVISNVNGCPEVVRDGIEGRLAPSEDLDAFVACLRDVVASPDRTASMIAAGKIRVEKEFTRARVVSQHLDLYQECLAKHPPL